MKTTILHLRSFALILIIMLALDVVYLSLFKSFFNKIVKNIQGSNINLKLKGAFMSYIIMGISVYYFLVLKNASNIDAFLLGMFIYGIFELTNYSIFVKWPLRAVGLELLWGGLLYLFTYVLYKKITGI